MAMNEKFKKDEVWGHLGKNNKSHSKDREDGNASGEDDSQDEDENELAKIEVKAILQSCVFCFAEYNFCFKLLQAPCIWFDYTLFLQPVYNKDDFFDTISCNALGNDSQNGRTRFSEQMKLDTEVNWFSFLTLAKICGVLFKVFCLFDYADLWGLYKVPGRTRWSWSSTWWSFSWILLRKGVWIWLCWEGPGPGRA